MPAKDRYHETVKAALIKDGWTIVSEQFYVSSDRRMYIDLEAEHPALAQSIQQQIILVEVKELFEVKSPFEALANAIGKFVLYQEALIEADESKPLYLAVSETSYNEMLKQGLGAKVVKRLAIPLIVFDPAQEIITQWLP